jgi:hypothetical protein
MAGTLVPDPEFQTLYRFRATREQLQGLFLESQGRFMALTVLHVPCSLDGGFEPRTERFGNIVVFGV